MQFFRVTCIWVRYSALRCEMTVNNQYLEVRLHRLFCDRVHRWCLWSVLPFHIHIYCNCSEPRLLDILNPRVTDITNFCVQMPSTADSVDRVLPRGHIGSRSDRGRLYTPRRAVQTLQQHLRRAQSGGRRGALDSVPPRGETHRLILILMSSWLIIAKCNWHSSEMKALMAYSFIILVQSMYSNHTTI